MQVHAEDGDKGVPREIRYGLVSEGNPFTSFFDINDTTGMFQLTGAPFSMNRYFYTSYPILSLFAPISKKYIKLSL